MKILRLSLRKSNESLPVLSVVKQIEGEEYPTGEMFPLNTAFGRHHANEFLRSLHTGLEIKFVNFKQFIKLLKEINTYLPLEIENKPILADTKENILRGELITKIYELSADKLEELLKYIA